MSPEAFVELRCLIAACRGRGLDDAEIELILYTAGLTTRDIRDLVYRWQ